MWAPELFFDGVRRRWIAYWSSSVDGRFPETSPPDPSWNNRMYYAESVDNPRTFDTERLLYDGGFITNDGFLIPSIGDPRGNYCLATKKVFSTPEKHGLAARIYLAFGDQPTGPFHLTGEPITGDLPFCEGPTITRVGRWYYCCFGTPKAGHMNRVRSETLRAAPWDNISGRLTLPPGARLGSVLPIPHGLYRRLLLKQ